jgi:hypothetical protein
MMDILRMFASPVIVLYLLSNKIAQWMYILEVIAFITVSIALYA